MRGCVTMQVISQAFGRDCTLFEFRVFAVSTKSHHWYNTVNQKPRNVRKVIHHATQSSKLLYVFFKWLFFHVIFLRLKFYDSTFRWFRLVMLEPIWSTNPSPQEMLGPGLEVEDSKMLLRRPRTCIFSTIRLTLGSTWPSMPEKLSNSSTVFFWGLIHFQRFQRWVVDFRDGWWTFEKNLWIYCTYYYM